MHRVICNLCDPCLSALRVCVRTKMALYKYSSFSYLFKMHFYMTQ